MGMGQEWKWEGSGRGVSGERDTWEGCANGSQWEAGGHRQGIGSRSGVGVAWMWSSSRVGNYREGSGVEGEWK